MSEINQYKGYALFNDVEDRELRVRNRATVLANIFEDNSRDGKVNLRGNQDAVGYFAQLPKEELRDIYAVLSQVLVERGITQRVH